MQKPTIGKIVHTMADDGADEVWPAIITKVLDDNTVMIRVFGNNSALPSLRTVAFNEGKKPISAYNCIWPVESN